MLVLTDKIFPQAALQAMIAVAERTFDGLRNAELDAQSVNRFKSLEKANVRSAIGSIMSRNGSHNLGSHILVSLAHEKGGQDADRAFYQYVQHRMDYLATVTADFPKWRLSTAFVGHMLKEFFEQPHLINYIARSEGLKGYRFSTEEKQEGCIRFYIRRLARAYYSEVGGTPECSYPFGNGERDFIVYSSTSASNTSADMSRDDLTVAIPGGVVGQHAFYTILENILRNAAKHELSALRKKDEGKPSKYSLALYIDFWDNPHKNCVDCCVWTCAAMPESDGGLSFKARTDDELRELCADLEDKFKRPFMDENNRLRRADWGIAEMRISAGYLWGSSLEQIGGRKSIEILDIIRPVIVDLKDRKATLGYRFRLHKSHELAVVFPNYISTQSADRYLTLFGKADLIARQRGIRMFRQLDLVRNDFDSAYEFVLFDNTALGSDVDIKRFPFRILAKRCLTMNPVKGVAYPKSPDAFYRSVEEFVSTVAKGDAAADEACLSLLADVYGAWLEYLNGLSEDNSSETCVAIDIANAGETASLEKGRIKILTDVLETSFDMAVDEFLSKEREASWDRSFSQTLEKLSDLLDRRVSPPEMLAKRFQEQTLTPEGFVSCQLAAWCLDNLAMSEDEMYECLITRTYYRLFLEYVCGPFLARYKSNAREQGDALPCMPPIFRHDIDASIDSITFKKDLKVGREKVSVWLLNYRPRRDSNEYEKFMRSLRYLRHENAEHKKNELYCEALSGSQSYLPQFASFCKCAAEKSAGGIDLPIEEQRFLVSLVENARLRVMIVDERALRYVNEHPETKNRLLGMGVSVRDDSDADFLAFLKKQPRSGTFDFDGVCVTEFHILILHQGIIDKHLPSDMTESDLHAYLNSVFPYVVITTGRGIPANIPDGARVLPYSVVEDAMLKAYPEKLILIDAVMNLLPNNKKERANI